ncbi:LIC10906 family membrane protein [Leptospira yasudae]|uniref:LIC10906 family membrane protein n=1 Tax=Leptospira yasudae TaxID=2202201 RepID=UPI001091858A|nr:histidine kinase N-terminal 7TM domain-containing protein [Leptospira yasudae]TGM98347.1 hypothetical protein EHR10_12925 [Leptospira yasudae]
MNLNILIPGIAGLIHLVFGIYVFRLNRQRRQTTQRFFLYLNLLLAAWLFTQAFRNLLPIEYRNLALNITFLPIAYATFVLYSLCKKIEHPQKRIPIWSSIFGFLGLSYITSICLSQRMGTLKDPYNFIFDFNLHYHLMVVYLVFWMIMAIYAIARKMIVQRGDFKVRLFLVMLGALLALPITMLFVYFLPLLGLYKPYLSSLGLILASIFWAVGILHYDAFEIKSSLIRGQDIPLINKAASKGFIKLLEKLDPIRFLQKRTKEKAEITKEILIQDYNLATGSGELSVEKRAEILSKKFGKYFK